MPYLHNCFLTTSPGSPSVRCSSQSLPFPPLPNFGLSFIVGLFPLFGRMTLGFPPLFLFNRPPVPPLCSIPFILSWDAERKIEPSHFSPFMAPDRAVSPPCPFFYSWFISTCQKPFFSPCLRTLTTERTPLRLCALLNHLPNTLSVPSFFFTSWDDGIPLSDAPPIFDSPWAFQ